MPPQPGEVSLLTLFADVHYYFNPPTSKPLHHRFDKGSYVYLYHDAIHKRGRIEIANHAGTADQDAFMGFLDGSLIESSEKHPTLFSITVDPRRQMNEAAQSPQQDTSQWHLPAHDLRNETKYMYKLHAVDLYFWTADDATLFLDSLRRCLHPQQIRIPDAEHSEHRESMSPVVQRLEKAAISSPDDRSNSVSTAQSSTAPPSSRTPISPITTPGGVSEAPAGFAPAAYNPAAPGQPERIAHREKTPPPVDAASGTGLAAAAMHEHGAVGYGPQPGALQHQGSYQLQAQQSYMPGAPTYQNAMPPPPPPQQMQRTDTSGSFPPPPPQQSPYGAISGSPASSQQYAQSYGTPPSQTPPASNANPYGHQHHPSIHRQSSIPVNYQQSPQQPMGTPTHQQSFSPQPVTQYANYNPQVASVQQTPTQHSPAYQMGVGAVQTPSYVPGTPGYGQPMPSPGFAGPPQQPQVPIGGYSQYNYSQQATAGAQQYSQEAYTVHQQVYRPTEGEAAHGQGNPGQPMQAGPGQQAVPGRLEGTMGRVEKGVGRLFKRLDKKL